MLMCGYWCRSFDQFANLVLEGAVERIIVGILYAEDPLGLYVVRGENVVLLGDIDPAHDPPAILQKVLLNHDSKCTAGVPMSNFVTSFISVYQAVASGCR